MMVQFMTAAEQVEHGHRTRGEPTYAELQAINVDLLTALETLLTEINPPTPGSIGETRIIATTNRARAAIAKGKGK